MNGQLVQLVGNALREKALDVAAFRLSELTAAALAGHTFLTPADALLKRVPLQDGLFFVYTTGGHSHQNTQIPVPG